MARGDFGTAEQLRVQLKKGILVYIYKASGSVSITTTQYCASFQ